MKSGLKWFKWFCDAEHGCGGSSALHLDLFLGIVRQHFPTGLPGPFNDTYRGECELGDEGDGSLSQTLFCCFSSDSPQSWQG